jgi:ubiquinone/menaquinone biosynthesis C-methylase UbiE
VDTLGSINEKTRQAYDLAAENYHNLFHNEMKEKEYDRKLLDAFGKKFAPGSLICDAGCGPSAHIGRYLFDKGMKVIGLDISERCVELAAGFNPGMQFQGGDIARMGFRDECFQGLVSYYSIIHTPKKLIPKIFGSFYRVLMPKGFLLVAVKAGSGEGFHGELLGIKTEVYFSLFAEHEIKDYFENAGFSIELLEKRNPYDFEINNERIFAVGKKR